MAKLNFTRAWLVLLFLLPAAVRAQESSTDAVAEAVRLRNAPDFAGSIALLQAHLRSFPNDGDAIRLLAQTQYWAQDFAGARRTYERALILHPEDSSLRRQYEQFLAEIARSRGWVSVNPSFHHDDQPLSRFEVNAEAGAYLAPATSLALSLTGTNFRLADTASRSVSSAVIGFSHASAESGASISLSGGALHRSFDSKNDLIGKAAVGFKLSPAVRARLQFERAAYLYTEASLSTSVMTNMESGFLTFNASNGWLGELSAQLQQYPDDNSLTTAYGWFLAPVARTAGQSFHVGYSGAYQNAAELRFQLETPNQKVSPASSNFNFGGRYSPYYTPLDLQTHSLISALALGLNTSSVFRVNGSYAVVGSENSPHFAPVSLTAPPRTEARLNVTSRDTHPWTARATLEFNSTHSPFLIGAEAARTAFYSSAGAFASWTLKF